MARKQSAKARAASLRNLRKARAAQRPRRRRSARRAARAQRRTVRRMAKKRRSGGRRRKVAITPKGLAKLAVVAVGVSAGKPAYDEASYILTHANQIAKEGLPSVVQHGKQLGSALIVPGAIVIGGPKAVDATVSFLNKGTPLVNRVANAKIMSI